MATLSLTRNDIIRDAFEDLSVIPYGQDISAIQLAKGARKLNMLLLSDQNVHKHLTRRVARTFNTVASTATYALQATCITPENIHIRVSGNDIPLEEMTKDQYDAEINKAEAGQPDRYYIDYLFDGADIYLLPVPTGVYAIRYTSLEEFDELNGANDTIPLRSLWYEYLVHQLAFKLALWADRADKMPLLEHLADKAKREAMTFDGEVKLMRKKAAGGVV